MFMLHEMGNMDVNKFMSFSSSCHGKVGGCWLGGKEPSKLALCMQLPSLCIMVTPFSLSLLPLPFLLWIGLRGACQYYDVHQLKLMEQLFYFGNINCKCWDPDLDGSRWVVQRKHATSCTRVLIWMGGGIYACFRSSSLFFYSDFETVYRVNQKLCYSRTNIILNYNLLVQVLLKSKVVCLGAWQRSFKMGCNLISERQKMKFQDRYRNFSSIA